MATNSIPTLSQFTAELRNKNVHRPNLYYVEIMPPPILSGFNKESELSSWWCSNAHTPQFTLFTDDNYLEAGIRRKFAYDQDWQNLILNFYVDQEFSVKKFFDAWVNAIIPARRKFNYPADYTADYLNLYILDQQSVPKYLYEFHRIFPKDVHSIELNYSQATTPSTLGVEFVFESVYCTAYSGDGISFSTKPENIVKPETKIVPNTNFEIKPQMRN